MARTHRRVLCFACLSWLMLVAFQAARSQEKAAEPPLVPPRTGKREVVEIFNGKDLTGWKGHEKYWSIKEGVILGKNTDPVPVSTYLLTEREFSDFRLVFDFKLAESEMHSGIALWGRVAPERGDPYTYAGHLVMFPSNYGFYDLYGRNSIHNNAAAAKAVGKQHDWNHIEILAQGNRIRFVLNGKLISDWREPEPERIKTAPIGLQLHSNKVAQEVQFKNLKLETFPEDKLTTLASADSTSRREQEKMRVYIGTYTGKKSKGIYQLELDLGGGKLSSPVLAGEAVSPSFLAIHPNQGFLYAVSEVSEFGGKKTGAVAAFSIDRSTGNLTLLNQQSCGGGAPCHLVVDHQGKNVLVANYTGGSVGVLPIEADGKLKPLSSFVQHQGTGANPKRQTAPHAHSVNLDPAGRFAFVADLGLDKVLVYRLDADKGTLVAHTPPAAAVDSAAGPRHFTFHPSGKYAYVINELANTVTAFAYDASQGVLKQIQTIGTLPDEFKGNSFTAEVQVHPNGKFLYGSNRGHDSLAIFSIDPATGKLTAVGHQASGIKTPRNFGIDPTGRYILVGNQASDSLILFRVDQTSGKLEPTESMVEVGAPVCIKFAPLL